MNTKMQGLVSLERAIQLLTPPLLTPPPPAPKVLTAEQVALLFGGEVLADIPVFYSEDVLAEAAEENRARGTDWRLVWHPGFSLREQYTRVGSDRNRQPCFDPDYT